MNEEFNNLNLNVANLSYKYKRNKFALNDINFNLLPGSINALIGPAGSGKTTLLKILGGNINSSYGMIKFNDHIIENSTRKKLTCFIRPNDPLPEEESFQEAILFYRNFQELEEKNEEITINTECTEDKKENELIKNLSEGERKLLSLELHLINKPLLLMDEPFSNLDPLSSLKIIEKIKELKVTTIVSIHHCNEFFLKYFDSILLLKEGKLVSFFKNTNELEEQIKLIKKENNIKKEVEDKIYDLFLNVLPFLKKPEVEPTKKKFILQTKLVGRKQLDYKSSVKLLFFRNFRMSYRDRNYFIFLILNISAIPLFLELGNTSVNKDMLTALGIFIPAALLSSAKFGHKLALFKKDAECEYYSTISFILGTISCDFLLSLCCFVINFFILLIFKSIGFLWSIYGLLIIIFGILFGYFFSFFGVIGCLVCCFINLYSNKLISPFNAILELVDKRYVSFFYLILQLLLILSIFYFSLRIYIK